MPGPVERVLGLARRPAVSSVVMGAAILAAVIAVSYIRLTESTPQRTLRQFLPAAARQSPQDKVLLKELVTRDSAARMDQSPVSLQFISGIIDLRIVRESRRGNVATIVVTPAQVGPNEPVVEIPYKLRKEGGAWRVDLTATAVAIEKEVARNPQLYSEILRRGRDRLAPWEREIIEGKPVPGTATPGK